MTDRELANYLSKVKLTERLRRPHHRGPAGHPRHRPQDARGAERPPRPHRHARRRQARRSPRRSRPRSRRPPPKSRAPSSPRSAQYALNYSKTLPDFICTQVTRRFAAPLPGTRYGGRADAPPSWQTLDTLTIKLSYFEQKEDYKLILVNNTVTTQDFRTIGGATSTGDFGSMMKDIFELAHHGPLRLGPLGHAARPPRAGVLLPRGPGALAVAHQLRPEAGYRARVPRPGLRRQGDAPGHARHAGGRRTSRRLPRRRAPKRFWTTISWTSRGRPSCCR